MSDHTQHSPTNKQPKLLDLVRAAIRTRHHSYRTEQNYVQWVKRFVLFHNIRHQNEMGENEINKFISHLAVKQKVSASTQNQALCAIIFLYRHVLIVENKPWKRNGKRIPYNKIVKLKAEYNEVYIRKLIKSAGGKWNNRERVWELPYSTTVDLGLEKRIVLTKSVKSFK